MRRFRFALDTVLRVTTTRVKLAQQEMALATDRHVRALGALRQAEEAYRVTSHQLIELETGRIRATEVAATRRYLDRLVEEVALRQGQLKEALAELNVARERLVEQRQSEKSLDNLRRHRLHDHSYEAERVDQRELDELGTQGFLRRAGVRAEGGRAS